MIFDSGRHKYELLDKWAKLPEGITFRNSVSLAIDSQDRVFIYSRENNFPMTVFDREGNHLSTWGQGWFGRAHNVHVGPDGMIYCADMGNHTVSKWTPEGKLMMTLGTKDKPSDTGYAGIQGIKPRHSYYEKLIVASYCFAQKHVAGPFNRPTGVYVAANGEIFVSDGYGNAQIHRFSPEGKLISSWGELGEGLDQFICPHSIWLDKQERLFVADRSNCRIGIFDKEGILISYIGELSQPCHAYVDPEETVFIPEAMGLSMAICDIKGKLLARWHNDELHNIMPFTYPHIAASDSRGDLYLVNAPGAGGGLFKFAKIS